ncbi:hydroxyacylglutathione hydrolase [Dermatophagoides farinae]|uniref:hydroxyacylglutathione hydrolase n=1 Tax=Dermatophagoides farinae TaxID=6954 RepID=A0A9D4P232_DERFA|nr:hydroxyacylglutathione hydrolase [Dermatophagoides farinae]
MDVHVVSALVDNYMYLIVDKQSGDAAVVDPVEPEKVMDLIQSIDNSNRINIRTILATHHHWDHSGGNHKMLQLIPGSSEISVVGGDDRIDAINHRVKNGDKLSLGRLCIECLHTPCHTSGHVCYKVSCDNEISIFTGDTLFVGGCGKFFEGTAQQMYDALIKTLGSLPDHSKIYCGHEYTLSNLKFAKHVEPNNGDIDEKIRFAEECRHQKRPTIPSTIGDERRYNPFMRVESTSVQQHVKKDDPIKVMAALREEKNNFKTK